MASALANLSELTVTKSKRKSKQPQKHEAAAEDNEVTVKIVKDSSSSVEESDIGGSTVQTTVRELIRSDVMQSGLQQRLNGGCMTLF